MECPVFILNANYTRQPTSGPHNYKSLVDSVNIMICLPWKYVTVDSTTPLIVALVYTSSKNHFYGCLINAVISRSRSILED